MITYPRGGRRPEMPSDPRVALRALRACRDAMVRVSIEVKIGGPIYAAAGAVLKAIDAMAAALTGDRDYFREPGGGATEGEKASIDRKRAIERGDLPWPK